MCRLLLAYLPAALPGLLWPKRMCMYVRVPALGTTATCDLVSRPAMLTGVAPLHSALVSSQASMYTESAGSPHVCLFLFVNHRNRMTAGRDG